MTPFTPEAIQPRQFLKLSTRYRSHACLYLCFLFIWLLLPGAKAQHAEDYQWKNVAIGGGGFVSAIVPSKTEEGLMYARTDVGGAYRWDADNRRWIPLLDWVSADETGYLGVESLAIDEKNPGRVYMLVGISYFNGGKTAILRSDDYGNTFSIINVTGQFKAHGNGMGRQTGEKLVVDPNNSNILFSGTRWNGLFKSTDEGLSWSKLNSLEVSTTPNENGISFVVMDPATGTAGTATQTMFVGVSRSGSANLYRSDDGGATFSPVAGAPTTYMPHRAKLAQDGNLYITYGNGAGPHGHWAVPEPMDRGQIWKYNTQTEAWTNITPSGISRAFGGISIDPGNPNRLVASTINTYMQQENSWGDRIFLSTDGGRNWTDIIGRGFRMDPNGITWVQGHAIHWAGSIEFDPFDTQKVWVTSGNGIFMTEDIEANPSVWNFTVRGLEETVPLNLISIPDGPVVSVIGDYDGFWHTDVSQYAPIHNPQMGTTTGLAYAAQNPDVLLRAGDKIYYSTDMGISWKEATSEGKKGQVAVSADGNIFLHSPEGSSTTYRSSDRGSSWTAVTGLNVKEAVPVADPVDPAKFYVYNPGTGRMMVSKNGGASFSAAGMVGSNGSKIIRTTPGLEGHLWVALGGGGLSRSTNAGVSFTKVNGVSASSAVGLGKAAEGSNYPTLFIWGTVNGTTGLFKSTDQGTSWLRVNDDEHEYGGPGNGQFVVGDMNVAGRVYMSTAGRGIVYGEPADAASCPAAVLDPHIQINSGTWEQRLDAELQTGDMVVLDPRTVNSEEGSWRWRGPQNFTANTATITIDLQSREQEGNYVVTYTNECGTQSVRTFSILFKEVTAVSDPEIDRQVLVYPNPSTEGRFTVVVPASMKDAGIEVYDLAGKLIHKQAAKPAGTTTVHKQLAAGMYLIKIVNSQYYVNKRVVVQ
ncbi:T9SS type A sorting domain-containing protein [Cesiribacter sp. SM1]|uniref:T9SS type A sorting domain-containing protein n=1 Tax=Cesiribacter sp. SM1 TaxID=2861196 RepID=UPI001CD64ACB|nr:T9SS type A sorting domain-containing protein [Cesiribacter sp. SM1]